MTEFMTTKSGKSDATLVLAHGAGAPMDSPFMNKISAGLAAKGVSVVRFEFAYMAARRTDGKRKPPPRAEKLMQDYIDVISEIRAEVGGKEPLFIGGKSMGGRVAGLIAEELFQGEAIAGLVCLGYPFHPPGRPDNLRTAHLEAFTVPALICQGVRDPFGTRAEVADYGLSDTIDLFWLEDGDHDLKPRKASGRTHAQNIEAAAQAVADWIKSR